MRSLCNKSISACLSGLERKDQDSGHRHVYRTLLRRASIASKQWDKYNGTRYWPWGTGLDDWEKSSVRNTVKHLSNAVGFAESIGLSGLKIRRLRVYAVSNNSECIVAPYGRIMRLFVGAMPTTFNTQLNPAVSLFYALKLVDSKANNVTGTEHALVNSGAFMFAAASFNAHEMKQGKMSTYGMRRMCERLGLDFDEVNRSYLHYRKLRNNLKQHGVNISTATETVKLLSIENSIRYMIEGPKSIDAQKKFAMLSLLAFKGDVAALSREYLKQNPDQMCGLIAKRILGHTD